MENELTLDELFAFAKAIGDDEKEKRQFDAALQGIDLYGENSDGDYSGQMVDIMDHQSVGHGDDITKLDGEAAKREGFGIGSGLGFEEI